jgi:hypothetical protein
MLLLLLLLAVLSCLVPACCCQSSDARGVRHVAHKPVVDVNVVAVQVVVDVTALARPGPGKQ